MLVELALAGMVFPGTREDVHMFMKDKMFDYVGTVGRLEMWIITEMNGFASGVDDIFVRQDLSQGKYKFDKEMALMFETYSYDSYHGGANKYEL